MSRGNRGASVSAGKLAEIRALADPAAIETISWRRAVRRCLSSRRGVGGLEAVAATLKSFGRSSRDLLGELIPGIFHRRGVIGVSVRVTKLRTEALTTRGIK